MRQHLRAFTAGFVAVPCGLVAALAVSVLPGPDGLLAGAGLACYLAFLVWPWLCLPAGIVGGAVAAGTVTGSGLPRIVLIHGGILLAGVLALATRRLITPAQRRHRTAADPLMLVLVAAIALGAGYGLTRGNELYLVLVAAYQVAVIPAYFFLATATLGSRSAAKAAGVAFIGALVALALVHPQGDLGLFSTLALTPLLARAGSVAGWRRAALLVVCGALAAEVLLTEYRTLWVASGVALLILVVRGSAVVRTTTAVALAAGGLLVLGGAALAAGIGDRWAAVAASVADSPGYRQAEAVVGLRIWAEHAFFGAGLGQTSPDVYVEGLGVTDVGPTYHAFWMTVLANLGLAGLLVVLAPLLIAVRAGLTGPSGPALGFAALLCGFLVSATFAGPTDGHWELGLLAALTLLATRWSDGTPQIPFYERSESCLPACAPVPRMPALLPTSRARPRSS